MDDATVFRRHVWKSLWKPWFHFPIWTNFICTETCKNDLVATFTPPGKRVSQSYNIPRFCRKTGHPFLNTEERPMDPWCQGTWKLIYSAASKQWIPSLQITNEKWKTWGKTEVQVFTVCRKMLPGCNSLQNRINHSFCIVTIKREEGNLCWYPNL